MDALTTSDNRLPATIEDLSKFVLVGREKLAAVRAEIRAIQKVGLAKEVLEQKRTEAQEIAELVTLAEVRIGAMLKEIPKSSGGDRRSENFKNRNGAEFEKPKSVVLTEIGIKPDTAERFQRMAEHEDIVHAAIAEAKENDEIVTRSAVLKKIDEAEHKPHVSNNSGNNEWYTPSEYIEVARDIMGSIDLDPASSDIANKVVKADTYYTAETNGLDKQWSGNVWLNPPYASDLVPAFINKLKAERKNYDQAVVLVNNATETEWFRNLISIASAVCFLKGRVKFYMPDGKTNATPLQGQALVYVGDNPERFRTLTSGFGWRCTWIDV